MTSYLDKVKKEENNSTSNDMEVSKPHHRKHKPKHHKHSKTQLVS